MKGIVVSEPGAPEQMQLRTLRVPSAGPGHLIAQVAVAGVHPPHARNRADPTWAGIAAPYVVGYEFAGTVVQVGDAVDDLRPGDPVWAALPPRGTRFGTYAEYVALDATLAGRSPSRLNALEAASLPLAGSTALQILERLALEPGQSLLIHGAAGGVGSLLVQLARARGIRVAGSASGRRAQLLHQLGVEWPVDYAQGDSVSLAVEQRGGRFDAVADLVGRGLGQRSLVAIRDGGALASIVELTGDFEEAVDRNISLHGVLLEPSRRYLDLLADAVTKGELRPLVDAVLPLESAAEAHRRIESGHGQGKVVLAIDH